jgi:integrase
MPIYRRANSPYWWCRFTVGGRRVRISTHTSNRRQAEAFETKLRSKEWQREHTGARTWSEACARWLDEHEHKRSADRDRIIIQWTLVDGRLRNAWLSDIDRDRLDALRREKAAETSTATANRYTALIRSILNACAREWGWLATAPKAPMFPAERTDYQWLTQSEFAALLPHLPTLTRQLARFAVATGLRRTNITHLRWSQVDLTRRHAHVLASQTKAGKPITVPLNDMAIAVLNEQRGAHGVWVFPWRDEPVYQVATKAWRRAVTAIGRPGFRFHDLRHTWASWHVQAGTPLHALRELGGWADLQMVTRYGHLDGQTLRGYAMAPAAFKDAGTGTKLAHRPVTATRRLRK